MMITFIIIKLKHNFRMKFAVLALLGAVSAQNIYEEDLTENISKEFSASAMNNMMRQLKSVQHTLRDMEHSMSKDDEEKMEKMERVMH